MLANYFMTEDDEAQLSRELCLLFPSLVFVDDQLWTQFDPPTRDTIDKCRGRLVYFWWRDLVPVLPCELEKSGLYRGPVTGCVLQFSRCLLRDEDLRLGQMRVFESAYQPALLKNIKAVFATMRRLYRRPNHSYLIGHHAAILADSGLRFRIHENAYLTEY